MSTAQRRPRIFVTQPVSETALKRLRAVATVKVFPDARRIIPKRTLLQAVRRSDILFCLLHDKIDRAVEHRRRGGDATAHSRHRDRANHYRSHGRS
jgi:hypothetical protein